jgi:hypothetical protein
LIGYGDRRLCNHSVETTEENTSAPNPTLLEAFIAIRFLLCLLVFPGSMGLSFCRTFFFLQLYLHPASDSRHLFSLARAPRP